MAINISDLMTQTGVKFGTSGVRGLVVDMTDRVCVIYVTAFLQYLQQNDLIQPAGRVGIAGDLRNSTPRIMNACAAACTEMGYTPINYGHIPSPALALMGLTATIPTIMVTGSHIPDDRNGIKFNTPKGEILKPDELGIRQQQVELSSALFQADSSLKQQHLPSQVDTSAEQLYIERFVNFLPENCLSSYRIGLYEHSAVARDCAKTILQKLGAEVTSLGRSDQFISVDTEAIRPEDVALAKQWSEQYQFDCIVSTDGDSDRPLVSDENGQWLRGDVAGILCARFLGAETVITPVSSNTAVEKSGDFKQVLRTKIGSPFVIEAMQNAQDSAVIGYEANGGFLQQTDISTDGKRLNALPTRDALIVPLAIMLLAKQSQQTISQLVASLPERYTFSDRIKEFPTEKSQAILADMTEGELAQQLSKIGQVFNDVGQPKSIDMTDGIRITFDSDDIVHLRPSGNAPELRCYTESDSPEKAQALNKRAMNVLRQLAL